MAERKLDIFRVLKEADLKHTDFYASLTEEERKNFLPFLVTRWLSGTPNRRQIIFLNELVNPFTFSLVGHKELLWKLMTVCTSGKPQRYFWNKLPSKANSSKPISVQVVAEYFQLPTKDAQEAIACLSGNDVLDMAEELGRQPEEIAKLRKEYKGEELRSDGTKQTRKKKKEVVEAAQGDFFEF